MTADFGITHISFIFLFFDSKPGSCQPICGIIIVNNKSFSSAKAALVCTLYFLRSRGCAVQNRGALGTRLRALLLTVESLWPHEVGSRGEIYSARWKLMLISDQGVFRSFIV